MIQLLVSNCIAVCLIIKMIYLLLNKHLGVPYQQFIHEARLVAGVRRWSAPTHRLRQWYSMWNRHQSKGNDAGKDMSVTTARNLGRVVNSQVRVGKGILHNTSPSSNQGLSEGWWPRFKPSCLIMWTLGLMLQLMHAIKSNKNMVYIK